MVCLLSRCVRRRGGDEELRAVGVRARVRHRQDARLVELAAALELVRRRCSPGRPRPVPVRVAALDHEVGDDAVELGAVVERGSSCAGRRAGRSTPSRPVASPTKFATVFGASLREELHHDVALAGLEGGAEVLARLGLLHPRAAGGQGGRRRRRGRRTGGEAGSCSLAARTASRRRPGQEQTRRSTAALRAIRIRWILGRREFSARQGPSSPRIEHRQRLACGGLLGLLLRAAPGPRVHLGAHGDLDLEGLLVVGALLAHHPVARRLAEAGLDQSPAAASCSPRRCSPRPRPASSVAEEPVDHRQAPGSPPLR